MFMFYIVFLTYVKTHYVYWKYFVVHYVHVLGQIGLADAQGYIQIPKLHCKSNSSKGFQKWKPRIATLHDDDAFWLLLLLLLKPSWNFNCESSSLSLSAVLHVLIRGNVVPCCAPANSLFIWRSKAFIYHMEWIKK